MNLLRILEIHQKHGNIGSATGFEAVSNGLKEMGFDVYRFSLDEHVMTKDKHTYFLKFQKRTILQQIFSLKIALALFSYIRRIRPDIIHFHAIDTSLLGFGLPILYGKLAGAKVVKTQHDWGIICTNAWHVKENETCSQTIGLHCWDCYENKIHFLRDYIGKKLLRNPLFHLAVDEYTVPSKALMVDLKKFGYGNVRLIPNFLDREIQKRRVDSPKENRVIFIGRFVKEKGIDQVIECMSLIKQKIPDSDLVIVGKGTEEEIAHLQDLINKINGKDFIHVYEGVSDSEKNELIQKSKVCIISSIWKENFPLVVLEVFAYNVPVVAFNIGGLPEILQDERVLAEWKNVDDLAEKIVRIFRDETLRQELIHGNILRSQNFTKGKIIKTWSDFFFSLN